MAIFWDFASLRIADMASQAEFKKEWERSRQVKPSISTSQTGTHASNGGNVEFLSKSYQAKDELSKFAEVLKDEEEKLSDVEGTLQDHGKEN